jgi:hypothetical protein
VRRALTLLAALAIVAACAGPTTPATPAPSDVARSAAPSSSAAALGGADFIGTWQTGPVTSADVESAILAEGLTTADFEYWAEHQDFAPGPQYAATPTMVVTLTMDGADRWETSVEGGGTLARRVEGGTWTFDGSVLNLATDTDPEDHWLLTPTWVGDELSFTVLDIQEAGDHEDGYLHLLNTVALYAAVPFSRGS